MDSLAFANARKEQWERLEKLTRQRQLNGAESDELYRLYQSAAGDLAYVRTNIPDPEIVLRLSALLGRTRSRITSNSINAFRAIRDFFVITLPLSVYRIRWWVLVVSLACIAIFFGVLFTVMLNPALLEQLGSEEQLDYYARVAFEAYYSEYSNSDFAAMVWTNNAWIAVTTIAGGITGVFPLYMLWSNSLAVGQAGAVLESRDMLDVFFQLILPHGQLELCAVFIAGAAAFKLFWAWVRPRNYPRIEALAREGKYTVMVTIALVIALFAAGLVEGFVTPSSLDWWVKILIGSFVFLAFWFWIIYCGRRALKQAQEISEVNPEIGWTVAYA
ncbi:MAG: stage II sporulation protein M [Arcanobacterium sp.]|nr:stage II sporulation protein M [Arcanobacterium sp.]